MRALAIDAIGIGGLAIFFDGLRRVSVPAMLMVGGIMLIVLAVLATGRGVK